MSQLYPVVRNLDHVMIEAEDPTALYRLFSEGFGLPVAWEFGDYGGLWSGGVCAGNVNLEFCRFKELRFGHRDGWDFETGQARLGGLAFEPTMPVSEAIGVLSEWGVPFGGGQATENWTDLEVKGLLDPPGVVFLAEYQFDHDAWQAGHLEAFRAAAGGALGVEGIQEIHVGVRDVEEAAPAWSRFLRDVPAADAAAWRVGDQLILRLVPWGKDEVASMVLRVRSLNQATEFLSDAGMPALETLDGVTLDAALLQNLHVQLVDGAAPGFGEP